MHLKLERLDLFSRSTGPKHSQTYSAVLLIYLTWAATDKEGFVRE